MTFTAIVLAQRQLSFRTLKSRPHWRVDFLSPAGCWRQKVDFDASVDEPLNRSFYAFKITYYSSVAFFGENEPPDRIYFTYFAAGYRARAAVAAPSSEEWRQQQLPRAAICTAKLG